MDGGKDAKPRFMSKAERRRLALERLQKKRERPSEPAAPSLAPPAATETTAAAPTPAEMTLIRAQYLGADAPAPQRAKKRQRFEFDWRPEDDTSGEANPLHAERGAVSIGFGRGFVAGVDRDEQRAGNSFYRELVRQRVRAGDAERPEAASAAAAEGRAARAARRDASASLRGRHWSEKKLDEMEARDWRIFKEDFNIATRGERVPRPLRFWSEAGFGESLRGAVRDAGYDEPTPIQRAAIPLGMRGRDVVGIAETGSGKTAAFLLPLLDRIARAPPVPRERLAVDGPLALVLAPTRELAQQIAAECAKFASRLGYRCVTVVGGLSIQEQAFLLREGAEIVVATPGRLAACIEQRYAALNQCGSVVLDEADRMIDLNYEEALQTIMDALPADDGGRQTTMFSATMPPKVERLSKSYLREPVFVSVGSRSGETAASVEQAVEFVAESQKRARLAQLVRSAAPPVIVFVNLKKNCDGVARFLGEQGHRAAVIHGGKAQEARMESLRGFKDGTYGVLVATDVAGRGLDITGVKLVVNYDMPAGPEAIERYTHRIGRTGRAGERGRAVSFLTAGDSDIFDALRQLLERSKQRVPRELAAQSRRAPATDHIY